MFYWGVYAVAAGIAEGEQARSRAQGPRLRPAAETAPRILRRGGLRAPPGGALLAGRGRGQRPLCGGGGAGAERAPSGASPRRYGETRVLCKLTYAGFA